MPRHRRFTTGPSGRPEPPDQPPPGPLAAALTAGSEFRFPPSPRRRKRPWEWLAALLLHAAIIAAALITFQPQMSMQGSQQQTPVSIVVDNAGSQQTVMPPPQLVAPPKMAQAPPSSAPPPPPQAAQPQTPEMSLNIPPDLFAQEELPPSAPQPQQQTQTARPVHHDHPRQQYQVMTGMSLGNGSSASAQPPMPPGFHGLNMQLSQADRNAMEAPQITVQGQEGTSVIEFTVHRDGSVTGIHLLSSAGSPFLDQAWLGIFIQNHVPPFPPGTKSDTLKITASLEYVIEH
jgi:protein TonB